VGEETAQTGRRMLGTRPVRGKREKGLARAQKSRHTYSLTLFGCVFMPRSSRISHTRDRHEAPTLLEPLNFSQRVLLRRGRCWRRSHVRGDSSHCGADTVVKS
jgi:hypothetical protein